MTLGQSEVCRGGLSSGAAARGSAWDRARAAVGIPHRAFPASPPYLEEVGRAPTDEEGGEKGGAAV